MEEFKKPKKITKHMSADHKRATKEARLLGLLKRKHGGPITSAEQVDELLEREDYIKDRK